MSPAHPLWGEKAGGRLEGVLGSPATSPRRTCPSAGTAVGRGRHPPGDTGGNSARSMPVPEPGLTREAAWPSGWILVLGDLRQGASPPTRGLFSLGALWGGGSHLALGL
ncbi:membrane protein [Platysternon megacephalum]|uniref:Membrane protein n=1 Tax=Platysternon megacephalum TaxID=55544 RepID=A0A4D9DEC9_9SAUR|nr:membrane protein [Platysternon megacephalum]